MLLRALFQSISIALCTCVFSRDNSSTFTKLNCQYSKNLVKIQMDTSKNATPGITSTHAFQNPKIQQSTMLVTCQRFGDLYLFGLVWQHSSVQSKHNKGSCSKSWLLTCSSNIVLSLPSYTGSTLKRERAKFFNGYLILLYFWSQCIVASCPLPKVIPNRRIILAKGKLATQYTMTLLQGPKDPVLPTLL